MTASLENSLRLFKLTGWEDTKHFYKVITSGTYMMVGQERLPKDLEWRIERAPLLSLVRWHRYRYDECPAYGLKYLLNKIGYSSPLIKDNPATANQACLLAIKLFETGVLKK